MNPTLLSNSKKKKILNQLEKSYGINELKYLVIETGKGKYRIYSGSLSREEINELGKNLNLEIIGERFAKIDLEKPRINFDALNLPEIKSQLKEKVIEISDKEVKNWMAGENLDKEISEEGFVVIKNKGDILGSGQNRRTFIQNYVPKERRVRK
ncbi:MAG: hypothetical protein U9Q06_04100 [Nanoarchaeota archaeon]|nr:hypothetical protein [Nanoarchaeota archaeon]